MLHSHVYNSLPRSWIDAFHLRDLEFFHTIILDLSSTLAACQPGSSQFEVNASNLHVALALHNSLYAAGETCAFIMDLINL